MIPPMQNALEILRTNSLPMLLEQEIERVIMAGELAPGDRINEKEFALRFGTSRGPLRECLRSLEAAGLVEQVPNRGVFVRRVDAAQAAHVYDVRAALFALAGSLLAARATPGDVQRLHDFVGEMEEAVAREDSERYVVLNFDLHEFIVRHAGNPVLSSQYLGLVKQLRLCRARNLMIRESLSASNAEHRAMVEAVAAGDPERAAAAHHRHVANAKLRLMDGIAAGRLGTDNASEQKK
jgi:DNA-binding GntR family transcriptional regulator